MCIWDKKGERMVKDVVDINFLTKPLMSGKVFVVQEVSGRNILSAEKYGELELLLPNNSQIVLSSGPTVRRLNQKLKNFSDDDYLLLMGDPSAIGIACAIASSNNRGRFKCLKWDKREFRYYPVQINLYEKGQIDD
jgi:hypothetical protein|tara:strand:+ start:395 stop:802 length:408 start_codon:yes stop_codon:yes gene_type:complete